MNVYLLPPVSGDKELRAWFSRFAATLRLTSFSASIAIITGAAPLVETDTIEVAGLNPLPVATTAYVPGAIALNENSPASLLVACATILPLESCSDSATCLIGLPSASFTTPVIRYFFGRRGLQISRHRRHAKSHLDQDPGHRDPRK